MNGIFVAAFARSARALALTIAASVGLAACGDSEATTDPFDATTDSGDDTSPGDTGGETGDDTGGDVGSDTGGDSGTDADDTTTDIGPDIDPTLDRDNDGLTDLEEITIWGTSPIVADTDGDGFSDKQEVVDLAFDRDVDNFQFNPLVADRPTLEIQLSQAPVIYAIYETTSGTTRTIGQERSEETRSANSRSWGGSNSYSVEQSHTVGVSVGFSGWKLEGSVSYEYSYSTTSESTNEWSQEQTAENAETLAQMEQFEESNSITTSGGIVAITARINNPGDIAYFLDNLTLTAYELDPLDPENTSPVGTLTFIDGADVFPRTRLEPGERSAPLTFAVELDLPTIEALLANSRNLMIAPATWLIEGDGTVNFELAATSVNARTAEIIIDYGFERPVERYRVSTVATEGLNYITVDDAFERILRIPYTQGTLPFRRAGEDEPTDTMEMLTGVRSYGSSDEDTILWTVVHSYPINNGADTQVDQYHPFTDELDFGALRLQKGHTLQLIRIVDTDRDGLGERSEYAYGTDPNNPDTDGDGCNDGFEVAGWTVGEGESARFYRSSPVLPNTDFDLFDDCEEYAAGTNPMSADNTPPTASVSVATADGVRAVFRVAFADDETPVLELRYRIDGGTEQTRDVSASSGPVDIEHVFSTAGAHTFEVVSFDGALLSAPATVGYTVGPPNSGVVSHWPISGSTDSAFTGNLDDIAGSNTASARNIRFVTGRDDSGRGAAKVNFDGESGIFYTGAVDLGANFTVSAWIRFESIYSDMFVFGQHDRFAVSGTPSAIGLHDMHGTTYADSGNRIVNVSMGGSTWDEEAFFYHVALVVSGTTARLYINGVERGSGTINADTDNCSLIFGHPSGGSTACGSVSRAESHENGLNASFDDIRQYSRALSANEIRALYISAP